MLIINKYQDHSCANKRKDEQGDTKVVKNLFNTFSNWIKLMKYYLSLHRSI
jgi:hypothetical protein